MSLVNTIIFFSLFGIWSKQNLPNFFIKMMFLGMAIWNLTAFLG